MTGPFRGVRVAVWSIKRNSLRWCIAPTGFNWSKAAFAHCRIAEASQTMSDLSLPEQKNRLRPLMYARRAELAHREGATAALELSRRVASWLAGASGSRRIVSAFLPIRTEIDTRPLITKLCAAGITVVLPTIVGDNPNLEFRAWQPGEPLAKGAFGVEEPLSEADVLDPTTLIVPLLAFDRDGYRLGYGGGYYDRAIDRLKAKHTVQAIGIAYDGQEVVHVPREGHDERLTAIITPERVIEFEGE